MRMIQTTIGAVLLLMGLLWIGQGANLIGGSFMSGQSQWLYIGIVVAIVGVALLVFTHGRRRLR